MISTEVMSSPSLDDAGSNRCQSRSRHASQEDCSLPASNQDADELFAGESDSALALAIHASMEDFEVQVGPISGYMVMIDTLPWNPHHLNSLQHSTLNDDAASPRGSEKEVHYVKFRRVNIVQDVLNVFMDPKVMEVQLIMELINEKALDGEGVSREVYSAFWELFLQQCEGEDERVPRLRPDYSEKEWQAVGRVWIKGYMDHNIIPIRLSPAFILSCCQGVSSVDEELLMMSFLRYLSVTERESVEKVLEGNLEEIDEEDLLDLFSRMGSHCLPSKDKIRAAIVVMAHKALLQEPKFIIDCFHSSIHNAVPRLLTKESIMELYENKRPTNRKVAQMIKPSNESLNPQEQAALTYLLRLCGLSGRPVAHTCGAVLELPCSYSSYPDFRAELDSVLSGDCFTMDVV
ncbi:LPS-assembly lipoprotein LptE [Dissostichus eleginoides]|uniref:LPS-assembly lipoprotein LptE n=1 Tax=Dissostichus eleginoides TaxID=100907 RepID=A0AAD9BA73_DISEL|nr:LPS-assembly lipoprotein LptE [Dissostichus eleginoides]